MDYKPGSPPPGHNVLRPHHIGACAMILPAFKEFYGKLPLKFLFYIYGFLIQKVRDVVDFLKGGATIHDLSHSPQE
ncbi:hypothetical protein EDC04DRAFT_2650673 [Pisolithus marmoratus]|nr:hypothetical protein EDC04DRAFT_2650673 [Pisolithus marmoratus]